jgi:long-chain acyl-CoA synthetase
VEQLCSNKEVKTEIMAEIAKLCKEHKLNSLEKPKDIFLSAEAFSVENNILTPTFKLKRNACRQVYGKQVEDMYKEIAIQESKTAKKV